MCAGGGVAVDVGRGTAVFVGAAALWVAGAVATVGSPASQAIQMAAHADSAAMTHIRSKPMLTLLPSIYCLLQLRPSYHRLRL